MTSPTFLAESTPKTNLDNSFATINWQAPWLCHLNQLSYLSQQLTLLSTQNKNTEIDNGDNNKTCDFSTTIIADTLNTAMQQQANSTTNQLPQTISSADNQAHDLMFVSQDALPEGLGYEYFIATTGKIPTRNNLHDLFNGSIWLTFPKTKALLNYYHMLEIAACNKDGRGASRGRVRDTITVFDENGAILVTADPSIGEALIDFDWQNSLVTPCTHFDNPRQSNSEAKAAVYIFGHALLEQLIEPRKPLCAHSVVINVAPDFFQLSISERMVFLDNKLAKHMDELLAQDKVTPRQLSPLPILGVPHFWPENVNPAFYDDNYVFRSGRREKNS